MIEEEANTRVIDTKIKKSKPEFLKLYEDSYLSEAHELIKGKRYVEKAVYKQSGAIYTGYLIDDRRNGYGIKEWPDGAKYEGEWYDDYAKGRGKFWHADGDLYDGEWDED